MVGELGCVRENGEGVGCGRVGRVGFGCASVSVGDSVRDDGRVGVCALLVGCALRVGCACWVCVGVRVGCALRVCVWVVLWKGKVHNMT